MTKTLSRKSGKKGPGESAQRKATKITKKRSCEQEGMSRKWIIGVGVVCLLIAVVSVALYFVPSLEVAFKEKPSFKQDLDMRKQVVKDDVAGRRAKEKSDGENPVSMYRLRKNNTLMVGGRGVKMFKNRMKSIIRL